MNSLTDNTNIDPGSESRINGVFSTTAKIVVGFGHTKKKTDQNVLVYASEGEDGNVTIKALNEKFVPTGTAKVISKENLMRNYLPEPEIYMKKVYPVIRQLSKTVARGERHLYNGENYSAEMEFKKALRVDEENIRATFGLGLSFLHRGDSKRGEIVFRRLVKLRGAFEPKHKHMFNEFGIQLRKNRMFFQAIKYYARASKYSEKDENLYFNMARTYFEYGRRSMAMKFVDKALSINPSLDEAANFKAYLQKKRPPQSFKA
ncbi:MAG: tetratricopeptide repeat protein [Desulfonatronovibrio sp. MSAO_Bac4]|nr:MAG: tetratricopeptide repeat protein [Desulfonatronovibrio sp. MSAO_Bac4]